MKWIKFIILSLVFISCEKDEINTLPTPFLKVSTELDYNNDHYIFNYPVGLNNSYFKVDVQTLPMERVYWDSPDEFYVVLWNDTIWDSCVNYSTYSDDDGKGHQIVYVNPQFIDDTLNVLANIYSLDNDLITKEIKIIIN